MPREEVEEALKNPADILSQARFLPKYDGGEMVGFQINAIKSGSVLAGFGIENGDLITEFNGISITSPTESAKLLQEFNDSSSVSLVVQDADGDVRTINVDLDEKSSTSERERRRARISLEQGGAQHLRRLA